MSNTPETPASPADQLLVECSLLLSSFRWKLRQAGYPFREPPGVDAMLTKIDAHCFPEVVAKPGRKPRPKAEPANEPRATIGADMKMTIVSTR